VSGWARTADGWAANLDGSDAATVFSLPRLELRASTLGWRNVCLLADGTLRETLNRSVGSVVAAKASALEQAGRMLGPEHAAALQLLR